MTPAGSRHVRRLTAAEWRAYRDIRLRALADSPDAFGSLLEYEQVRPDEGWEERVVTAAGSPLQCPVVAVSDGAFVGLAWGRIAAERPEVADVFQMWVAPDHRGTGCGAALLDAIVDWAGAADARFVELRVTVGDSPAARLYARAGFRPSGEPEPLRPGSAIVTQPMRLDLRVQHAGG